MKRRITHSIGFTLVEILVVVSVIGVITAISTVGYGSWQQNLSNKAVTSDLKLASVAMEDARNFSDGYPASLPSTFQPSDSVLMPTIAWRDATRYCIQTSSSKYPTQTFYVDSTQGDDVRSGTCPASPIAPPPPPPTPPAAPAPGSTPTSSSTISVTWSAVATATSYTVRYGTGTPNTVACTTSATTCIINGLTANTVYNVGVVATNAYGSSPAGSSSATTFAVPPPSPSGTPAIAAAGPTTVYKAPGSTPYNRFTITASGSSCSVGALEWKIITSTDWSTGTWSTSNTTTYDQIATGSSFDRTYNAKPRCVSSGQATEHPSYASVTIPGCSGCR